MREKNWGMLGRREMLKTSAVALGGALLANPLEAYPSAVNTNSSPSTLKITDLRVATIVKPGPSPCPPASILRCHPNANVYLATNSPLLLAPELQATRRADTGDGDQETISQGWTSFNASAARTCVNVFSGFTASQVRAPSRHNPAATRNEAVQP